MRKNKMVAKKKTMLKTSSKGFTFIEIVVVIGIIGMISLIFYPDVRRSMEVRKLENEARNVVTTMQRAKFQAVKTKLNHRVGFVNDNNQWFFFIEREVTPDNWSLLPGFVRKPISPEFNVIVDFADSTGIPDKAVVFSPLGFVLNYDNNHHSLSLQSLKLYKYGQPDLRIIDVYAGGSIQYLKSESQ